MIIIILVILNVIFISLYFDTKQRLNVCIGKNQNFDLLSPHIAWQDVDQFLNQQKDLKISYQDMKPPLIQAINNTNGTFAIYFEDLTTGAWLGINEKQKYMPISLVKLPLLVATLKKVERDNLSLEQKVTIKKEFLDDKSGTLYLKGAGYQLSVKDLLIYLINESDNTAFHTLLNVTSVEEFEAARIAMGLPKINIPEKISPKDYGNMLRSLYLSTYLRRSFSELALSLMMETTFRDQIPAGLPNDIKVSHKVGFDLPSGYFHDCGIVYYKNPYILCIMSSGSNQEEANRVISNVSRIIYTYKTNN